MSTSSLRPADPATIGRYVLLGRVAAGGMGIVYLGRGDGRPDSLVVVKTARPDPGVTADFVERLRGEARLTAALAGGDPPVEGLARFVEADAESERPWIATEYVPGPSLHEAARGRPLADDVVAALAVSLAETIAALHHAGIAHRDVKPANVVVGPDGARLVDLGLARRRDAPHEPLAMGSPGWSPPEQHDARTDPLPGDVHGWGMSVAYAACGRPAFGFGPGALVTTRMLTGEPRLAGMPEHLRALVTAALRPEPLGRPTAQDIVDALASASRLHLAPPGQAARTPGSTTTGPGAPGEPAARTEELAPPTLVDEGTPPERAVRRAAEFPIRHRVPAVVAACALLVLGAVALGHDVATPTPAGAEAPAAARSAPVSPSPSASRSAPPTVLPTPVAHRTVAPPSATQHGKGKKHGRKR